MLSADVDDSMALLHLWSEWNLASDLLKWLHKQEKNTPAEEPFCSKSQLVSFEMFLF